MSVCSSVHMEKLGFHWREVHKTLHMSIFRESVEKIKFPENLTKITSTLREDQYVFLTISRSVLSRMGNI